MVCKSVPLVLETKIEITQLAKQKEMTKLWYKVEVERREEKGNGKGKEER